MAAVATRSPEPVKKVELKGKEKITVPVEKPPAIEKPKDKPPEDPIQNLTIPAQTLASADLAQAGAMEGIPTSDSLGLGRGGGAGTGRAPASVRAADRVLAMDGAAAPAAAPIVRATASKRRACCREVKPQYTAQAMRAKIQGEVLLECIVQPDGSVGKSASSGRSIRRSASIRKRSRPRVSGASRPAPSRASLSRCS